MHVGDIRELRIRGCYFPFCLNRKDLTAALRNKTWNFIFKFFVFFIKPGNIFGRNWWKLAITSKTCCVHKRLFLTEKVSMG